MAIDIYNAKQSDTTINNGSNVVAIQGAVFSGGYAVSYENVINTPVYAAISGKFEDRFDDPRYYAGDAAI